MSVLADHQILHRIKLKQNPDDYVFDPRITNPITVEPFEEKSPLGKISYGITSYGLDVRLGYKFKVFTNAHCGFIDPKRFDERSFIDVDLTKCHSKDNLKCPINDEETYCNQVVTGLVCTCPKIDHTFIPPNSFVLAETLEYLEIPRDCVGIVLGKSTLARCGIIVNVTPLEPQWKGKITMEISNTAPLPAKLYAGEGIAQILFLKGDEVCRTSYADKKGIYQNQSGLTLPRVKS